MALINEIIGRANFEVVRDQIGAVLLTELTKQKQLQPLALPEPLNIYQGRVMPISTEEQLYITVDFLSAEYNSYQVKSQQGDTRYLLDVYATGAELEGKPGSQDATQRVQRYLGIMRAILSATQYRTLGLGPGYIGGVHVESLQVGDADLKRENDAMYTSMGRLTLMVKLLEDNSLSSGENLLLTGTTVKLEDTDYGYRYEFET